MFRTIFAPRSTPISPRSRAVRRRMSSPRCCMPARAGRATRTSGRTARSFVAIGQDAILNNQFARGARLELVPARGDAVQSTRSTSAATSFEVIFTGYASQQHKFTQFDLGLAELTAGPRIAINQDLIVQVLRHRHRRDARPSQVHRIVRRRLLHPRTARQLGLAEGYVEHRSRRFFDSDEFPTASDQTGTPDDRRHQHRAALRHGAAERRASATTATTHARASTPSVKPSSTTTATIAGPSMSACRSNSACRALTAPSGR